MKRILFILLFGLVLGCASDVTQAPEVDIDATVEARVDAAVKEKLSALPTATKVPKKYNVSPTPVAESPVTVYDLSLTNEFGIPIITGTISNISNKKIEEIYIFFNGYNFNGVRIGDTVALVKNLTDKEVARFETAFLLIEDEIVHTAKITSIEINDDVYFPEELPVPTPTPTPLPTSTPAPLPTSTPLPKITENDLNMLRNYKITNEAKFVEDLRLGSKSFVDKKMMDPYCLSNKDFRLFYNEDPKRLNRLFDAWGLMYSFMWKGGNGEVTFYKNLYDFNDGIQILKSSKLITFGSTNEIIHPIHGIDCFSMSKISSEIGDGSFSEAKGYIVIYALPRGINPERYPEKKILLQEILIADLRIQN